MPRLCLCVLVPLLVSAAAQADERCPAPPWVPAGSAGAVALLQAPAEQRLRHVTGVMLSEGARSRRWLSGWASTYTLLSTGNFALAPTTIDAGLRSEYLVAGVTSGIGLLSLALRPPREVRDQGQVAQLLAGARGLPAGGVCARLAQAEALWQRSAADQAQGKGMLVRTFGWLFNLGIGAVLGFGLNRWETAARNTLAGIAVTELMLLTRPGGLPAALLRYRDGRLETGAPPPQWRVGLWTPLPLPGAAAGALTAAGTATAGTAGAGLGLLFGREL